MPISGQFSRWWRNWLSGQNGSIECQLRIESSFGQKTEDIYIPDVVTNNGDNINESLEIFNMIDFPHLEFFLYNMTRHFNFYWSCVNNMCNEEDYSVLSIIPTVIHLPKELKTLAGIFLKRLVNY